MTDKLADNSYKKRGGRPSAAEQATIIHIIKPYFEMGVSAEFVSELPGMPNVNTIKTYFRKWREELAESQMADLVTRQRENKAYYLKVYDHVIYNTKAQLNDFIEAKIKLREKHNHENMKLGAEGKEEKVYIPNSYVESMVCKLNDLLGDQQMAKAALENAPYVDEQTEQSTINRIQEQLDKLKKKKGEKQIG